VPWHLALGEGKIKKKDRAFPECLGNWHSGKIFQKKMNFFPECCTRGRGSKKRNFFPECCTGGRVKKIPSTALNLPRVLPWHSGKSSLSVRFLALGEELFPVSRFPGSSSPSVALGEGFPECFWLFPECLMHSGKQVAPVVY
jgi:hypothetical protein